MKFAVRRYAYGWVTAAFFLLTLAGHWLFGWLAFVNEQQAHQQPSRVSEYAVLMMRDTLENWQSEFLQLLWQVGGLAFLLYVGSPQSKEGDDRREAKIDAILKRLCGPDAQQLIDELDRKFPRR
jgi:hypothetical protein